MKKTREILLSVITIALLAVLTAGATYALFTSEAQVNTTITSATVDIDLKLKSIELYSLDVKQDGLTFENGGEAKINSEKEIELLYVSPGDKVVAHFTLENLSNITIIYNVTFIMEGELSSGLKTSVNGLPAKWTELQPNESIDDLEIIIELPVSAGNEYQDKTANVLVLVKAIQGNADPQISTADELQNELNNASTDANNPTVLSIERNLYASSPLVVKAGTYVEINLNGNDILTASDFDAAGLGGLVKVEEGASLKITDSSDKVRYGVWDNGKYVISDVNSANADVLPGGNVSLGNEAENFQLSTFVNLGTLTLDGVTVAGAYALEGNGAAIFNGALNDAAINNVAVVNLVNAAVCGNKTEGGSGVIYTNAKINITDSSISNNIGFNGGAIVGRDSTAVVTAENSNLSGNVAGQGAVLQLRKGASVYAHACTITNNEVKEMTYGNNHYAGTGVIIHIMGSDPSTVVVTSCPLSGNMINGEVISFDRMIAITNPAAGHILQIS